MSDRREPVSVWRILAIVLLAALLLAAIICTIQYNTTTGESAEQWQSDSDDTSSRININVAPIEDLMLLDGMTAATAERIVTYRERVGRFSTVDELTNVFGISEEDIARWEPHITI